jgi:RNA polymerase sigma-70 factor (ECF subfamily)
VPYPGEAELVERAKVEAEAFGALYDRYFTPIYRFVASRLGDRDQAEDVTSEVFMKALAGLPRYRQQGYPFSAWLYQIAVNAVNDRHRQRRHRRHEELSPAIAADLEPVEEQVARSQEATRAWAMVERLPDAQRMAIVLKFQHGLSNAEIGVALGRSEGAVKLLVHRGMERMRADMGVAV